MTLQQILKSVSSRLPPSFDRENIAAELWLQAWQRHRDKIIELLPSDELHGVKLEDTLDPPLSNQIIHNRCVDEIRKRSKEKNQRYLEMYQAGEIKIQEDAHSQTINELIGKSNLSRQAQRVIMEKFFLGSSLKLIAEHLMISTKEVSTILEKTLERLRAVARETRNEVKE